MPNERIQKERMANPPNQGLAYLAKGLRARESRSMRACFALQNQSKTLRSNVLRFQGSVKKDLPFSQGEFHSFVYVYGY